MKTEKKRRSLNISLKAKLKSNLCCNITTECDDKMHKRTIKTGQRNKRYCRNACWISKKKKWLKTQSLPQKNTEMNKTKTSTQLKCGILGGNN